MAALAALLDKVATAYQAAPEPPGDRTYQQLVARRLDEPPSTYPFERNAQQALATRFTDALIDAANVTAAALPEDLAEGAPKPHPEARIVPRT